MKATLEELWAIVQEADCIADQEMVEAAISRLAAAISADYAALHPVVYVVLTGGVIFAGQLLPRLFFPLELAYVHASRYRGDTEGSELHWEAMPSLSPAGRHVLVIDDILDEGYTLVAVRDHLLEAGALSVRLAVLGEKRHTRKALPGLCADYAGLELPDRYLFGYGLDYHNHWRNAPGIYAVKGL